MTLHCEIPPKPVCVPTIMSDKTFPLTSRGNKRPSWSEKTSNSYLKKTRDSRKIEIEKKLRGISLANREVWWFEGECHPIDPRIEHLLPSWWRCLGMFGLAGKMPLEVGFESLPGCPLSCMLVVWKGEVSVSRFAIIDSHSSGIPSPFKLFLQ